MLSAKHLAYSFSAVIALALSAGSCFADIDGSTGQPKCASRNCATKIAQEPAKVSPASCPADGCYPEIVSKSAARQKPKKKPELTPPPSDAKKPSPTNTSPSH